MERDINKDRNRGRDSYGVGIGVGTGTETEIGTKPVKRKGQGQIGDKHMYCSVT